MKLPVKTNYQERRRADYPSIVDQLDAIWKGGPASEHMRNKVLDVKRRHPKESDGK